MDILDDTLRLIASWRVYRQMNEDGRYTRLIADLALVIRSRLK